MSMNLLYTEILSSLLDDDYIRVPVKLANLIGLNEAIVLRKIHEWVKCNSRKKNSDYFYGEHYWTHQSYKEFGEDFPWWSIKTIQRTIQSLELSQLVISAQPERSKGDCTKWYRVDIEKLLELYFKSLNHKDFTPEDKVTSPPEDKMTSPSGQDDLTPEDKMTSSIYKDLIAKEEITKSIANNPPISPREDAIAPPEKEGEEILSVSFELVEQKSSSLVATLTKIPVSIQQTDEFSSGSIIPASDNHSLSKFRKPNGSEQFPWEQTDPIKGWTTEEGFLKYVWPLVKGYTNFKDIQNLPLKATRRALIKYVNKAHYEPERREEMFGHWEDYQDELNGVSDVYSDFTQSEATRQDELQYIHNASKKKFTL